MCFPLYFKSAFLYNMFNTFAGFSSNFVKHNVTKCLMKKNNTNLKTNFEKKLKYFKMYVFLSYNT